MSVLLSQMKKSSAAASKWPAAFRQADDICCLKPVWWCLKFNNVTGLHYKMYGPLGELRGPPLTRLIAHHGKSSGHIARWQWIMTQWTGHSSAACWSHMTGKLTQSGLGWRYLNGCCASVLRFELHSTLIIHLLHLFSQGQNWCFNFGLHGDITVPHQTFSPEPKFNPE